MAQRQHPHIDTLKRQFSAGEIGRREFLRTATLLGLSATAAYGLIGSAPASAQSMPRGGTLRVGMRVYPIKPPHRNEVVEGSNIIRANYEYLTRTGQDNITRPHLLSGWSASDDLRTWTLTLRTDVTWRNGRRFVADDVVWNIKDVLDPKTGSSMVGLMKSYLMNDAGNGLWDANAIEKVDDHTVRLNLRRPQLAVAENFFNHPMAIVDPEQRGEFGVGSNGTGPFELVEFEPGRRAVFKAARDYWGGRVHLDALEFHDLGEEPATAVAALRSSQVDGLFSLDTSFVPVFRQLSGFVIYESPSADTAVVRGKVSEKPFDDARVRRALRLAIDQDAVLAVGLQGLGLAAEHHHVSPIHPEYAPLPPFKRDTAQAKQLLAEAGYPKGLDLELIVNQDPAWVVAAALNMVNQWAEVGIRVKIQPLSPTLYNDKWKQFSFAFTPWRHRPLGIQNLSLVYRTGSPWNESGYSNPRLDELMTQAEGTLDVGKRRELMREIETIMQQDGPIVQPVWRKLYTVYAKRVLGFRMHPTNYIFAEELAVAPV